MALSGGRRESRVVSGRALGSVKLQLMPTAVSLTAPGARNFFRFQENYWVRCANLLVSSLNPPPICVVSQIGIPKEALTIYARFNYLKKFHSRSMDL